MDTIRLSLDLTLGTFSKLEEVCKEGYQNKAQFLRQLLDKEFEERKR